MTTSAVSCSTRSVIWLMAIFTLTAPDELDASAGKILVSFHNDSNIWNLILNVDDNSPPKSWSVCALNLLTGDSPNTVMFGHDIFQKIQSIYLCV